MFLSRVKLETFGRNKWRLLEPLKYVTETVDVLTVPKGFVCDLASIPRVFRLMVEVNGRHREAATLHDWLYYKKGHGAKYVLLTREQCDDLFYEAMINSGVPAWKAWTMWAGVRMGGWVAWSNK